MTDDCRVSGWELEWWGFGVAVLDEEEVVYSAGSWKKECSAVKSPPIGGRR